MNVKMNSEDEKKVNQQSESYGKIQKSPVEAQR